ncbi:sulfatase [Wenxinia saemankumensis]|uniref:Phosphoglycerol transferase MdoB n=1 Tax=Wenxinia saemankumensis TaxID=1447782 RepID=A0A1M6HF16_9RHOB|nr:sulfatase [Wenxinia saemankumensis]SHJ20802.1 Phosphoglycerol transferase MdoB [Wenxinia saemankumensis]
MGPASLLRPALAALVLFLVLIQPNHPDAMTWGALRLFPLELPAILLVLLVLPAGAPATRLVRGALVAVLALLALLKGADYGTQLAYGRSFDPVVDMHLLPAAWRLASGAVGLPLAGLALLAALVLTGALVWALWWATGVWARIALPNGPLRTGGALAALAAIALVVGEVGDRRRAWELPMDPPGTAFTARVAVERVDRTRRTLAQLADFTIAARTDPHAGAEGLFDRLSGRDVIIVFVESYGRASIDVPFYAETHVPTLRAAEASLDAAGLAMRSGWLTAPMRGGQSWLAHATLSSGLWTPDQTRYRAMLASPRRTLYHLAADAGFHTAAVMPAITYDWPEGALMGFDTIRDSTELGYAGPAFNWVTMPDQFTLAAFDRAFRAEPPGTRPPLFAQIALISSHAPWTPIPEMVPWEDVGDGSVYAPWDGAGDPPSVVWRDRERVREQYRRAIDYALSAAFSWAARTAPEGPLIVVLGDHQTADSISLSDSYDVPVHVIGPEAALAPLEGWGWTEGLVPAADLEPWRMDEFRDRFIAAYTSGTDLAGMRP